MDGGGGESGGIFSPYSGNGSEWIVLDDATDGSEATPRIGASNVRESPAGFGKRRAASIELSPRSSGSLPRPDSRMSELEEWAASESCYAPFRRTPDGLKAAFGMGLSDYQDSFAQAERSLAVLDGVDSEFLRKSTLAIEFLREQKSRRTSTESPFSHASSCGGSDELGHYGGKRGENDHDEEEAEDVGEAGHEMKHHREHAVRTAAAAAVVARDLKYGGRAPPIPGALAPTTAGLTTSFYAGRDFQGVRLGPYEIGASSGKESRDCARPCLQPVVLEKSKGERRRQRREIRARAYEGHVNSSKERFPKPFLKQSSWHKQALQWASRNSLWFCSHMLTLALGLYFGKQASCLYLLE